jgi:hypothetical protein
MNRIAIRLRVTGDGKGRIAAYSEKGSYKCERKDSTVKQIKAVVIVDETKLLSVQVEETKDHAETDAEKL